MDYNEFAQRIKSKYPEYKDMDNKELATKIIDKYPEYKSHVTFENIDGALKEKQGIDITPSGLARKSAIAISTPIRQVLYKESPEVARAKATEQIEAPFSKRPLSKGQGLSNLINTSAIASDVAPYFTMPQANVFKGVGLGAKLGNLGLTGAYQGGISGGLESLKQEGDLSDVGSGAGIGLATGMALPIGGKGITEALKILPRGGNLFARSLGRISPKTLERVVQPDSIALDLSEEQAQNLLMDTTERVQKNYKDLLNKRGQVVGEAIKQLPTDKGVSREELKKVLDEIYNNFSVSGNQNLNVARNEAGSLYNYANELIDNSSNDIVSASEVKDILKNIKSHAPKDVFGKVISSEEDAIINKLYGEYNAKLSKLSPELADANKAYAKLKDFEQNEGIKEIIRPNKRNPQFEVDKASRTLKNYNSTVTSGNKNRNIQDLEKLYVEEGYQPFLKDIDDVNAAMDLNNIRGTGDSWLANLTTNLTKPALKGVRELNRLGVPEKVNALKNNIGQVPQRIFPQYFAKTPVLYGQVEYNEGY